MSFVDYSIMRRLTRCMRCSIVEPTSPLSLRSSASSHLQTSLDLPSAVPSSSFRRPFSQARTVPASPLPAPVLPAGTPLSRLLEPSPAGPYYARPTPPFRVQSPRFNHLPNFCTPVIPPLPSPTSSTYFTLPAYRRHKTGSRDSRRLRETRNHVPVAVFDRHSPNQNPLLLSIERAHIEQLIRHWLEPCLMTRVGTLLLDDGVERVDVAFQDIERHSVSGEVLSMSFVLFDPTHRHKLAVPIQYINEMESIGVRRGGLLLHIKHAVQCVYRGEASGIPSKFIVDLMNVGMGAVINNTDIGMVPGLRLFAPQKVYVLAVIQGLGKQFKQQQADEAEVAAATGATTAAAATPAASAAAPAAAKKEDPKKK